MSAFHAWSFAVLSLAVVPAAAQQSEIRTLAELVSAAADLPLLASQEARVEEKRAASDQAGVWAGPTLGAIAGRTKQTEASGSRVEFSFSQPLPLTGIPGLRGAMLSLDADALEIERRAMKLGVSLAVIDSAYVYAISRRKAEFARKRQKRFELMGEYLGGRVFPTAQKRAESRIVRNRLRLLSSEALQSQAALKASLERLKVYVPLNGEPEVVVPRLKGELPLEEKGWLEKAVAGNPSLLLRRLAVSRADKERALASREGLPETSFLATYEKGQRDIIGTDFGVGVSLAFPSWNANRAAVRSAERRKTAEERELAFAERKLRGEVAALAADYEAARRIAGQYPVETLEDLDAQLSDAADGFQKGNLDLLTFLEIESSASETYGRALDAQRELAAKAAELMSAAGERDPLVLLNTL